MIEAFKAKNILEANLIARYSEGQDRFSAKKDALDYLNSESTYYCNLLQEDPDLMGLGNSIAMLSFARLGLSHDQPFEARRMLLFYSEKLALFAQGIHNSVEMGHHRNMRDRLVNEYIVRSLTFSNLALSLY